MFLFQLAITVLLSINIFAFSGGIISKKILKKADRKYGALAVKHYVEYNEMLEKAKHSSLKQKLILVNDFFNKIPFKKDIKVWKQDDYWATPLEFIARYKGDSEDYVIAKYFALLYLKIDPKHLYWTYVNSKKLKEPHMVLSYFDSLNSEPLILDNFNIKILYASKREDLTPIYNFNPNAKRKHNANKTTHKKWEKLYKRIQRNKL